ncbi:HlyC/CorC family transporter [Occultella glacieicola]|uniref:HlyC/CorC family transporter n=1 Tax=Occultella glacieicola TaxID=2518684 RepID=A0ABY2DY32_9MICO|nr:hemolysin family protein [Occultella glacieicola]TDE89219.1 HlyC/CorC family transporter [Occultella glacieicola]
MDGGTLVSIGLVLLFILIGGVFAATEIALVSLRESQIDQIAEKSERGARVAAVARDPNRFLAAVQIGVTVAGFFSAAYGASTIAPDFVPILVGWGMPESAASTVALIVMTLLIAYLSLVLGELVPKRFALQRSTGVALGVGPLLDRFSTLMRPVIWLLSVSTNAVVRLFGGDPNATNEEITDEELRGLVIAHEGLPEDERQILRDVFDAGERSVSEVMRPRHEVAFLDGDLGIREATRFIADQPYSRYPVIGEDFDDILGFVHVRDLFLADVATLAPDDEVPPTVHPGTSAQKVRDLAREIVVLPSTNALLPSMSIMRRARIHIAVVIDEYGGTDGIVTLEDLVEELVGEIHDEHDVELVGDASPAEDDGLIDAGLNLEDFADRVGFELVDEGDYETVGGYFLDRLGRVAQVGDVVPAGDHVLEAVEIDGHRIVTVRVHRTETGS